MIILNILMVHIKINYLNVKQLMITQISTLKYNSLLYLVKFIFYLKISLINIIISIVLLLKLMV